MIRFILITPLLLGDVASQPSQSFEAKGRPVPIVSRGLSSLLPVPPENSLTQEKVELGRRLFFDQRLSEDRSVSCASCHIPGHAFSDGREASVGVHGRVGRRNTPSLLNSAYATSMFWDGRSLNLEEQALEPLTNPNEMGNSMESVLSIIKADPSYRRAFEAAFGTDQITETRIARALASFQRTLLAGDAPFDRHSGREGGFALSLAARRGLELFRGKARCAHCHEGLLFTDQKFHNTGVSWGKTPLDFGRYEKTGDEDDKGKFKTPSLRNVSLTAPYMHDGSIASLREVIEFYNRGGVANPNQSGVMRKLNLLEQEKEDLLEFLHSLTSEGQREHRRAESLR